MTKGLDKYDVGLGGIAVGLTLAVGAHQLAESLVAFRILIFISLIAVLVLLFGVEV